MPYIDKLYKRLKAKGLNVLTIGRGADEATARTTWKSDKYTVPCDAELEAKLSIWTDFKVKTVPTIIVVNPKGVVVATFDDYYPLSIKRALAKLGIKY